RFALRSQTSAEIVPVLERHGGAGLVSLQLVHRGVQRNSHPGRDSEPAGSFPGVLQVEFVLLAGELALDQGPLRKQVALKIVVSLAVKLAQNTQNVGE